jgi:hypothetical protein
MRDAIAALNEELAQGLGVQLEIRIGLNTGEVVASDPSQGHSFAIGDTVEQLGSAQELSEQALARAVEAAEGNPLFQHGLEHARAAGDAMTEEDLTVLGLLVGPTGPFSAGQVISEAEAELERGRSSGSRRIEGAALPVLAICAAFEGRFAHARELLSESTSIDEQLGGGRGSGFQYTPEIRRTRSESCAPGYDVLRKRGRRLVLVRSCGRARRCPLAAGA